MVRLSVLVERLGGTCELAGDPELGQVFLDSRLSTTARRACNSR